MNIVISVLFLVSFSNIIHSIWIILNFLIIETYYIPDKISETTVMYLILIAYKNNAMRIYKLYMESYNLHNM